MMVCLSVIIREIGCKDKLCCTATGFYRKSFHIHDKRHLISALLSINSNDSWEKTPKRAPIKSKDNKPVKVSYHRRPDEMKLELWQLGLREQFGHWRTH
jgi:hypothetical protein